MQTSKCPSCGSDVTASGSFCPRCGAILAATSSRAAEPPATAPSNPAPPDFSHLNAQLQAQLANQPQPTAGAGAPSQPANTSQAQPPQYPQHPQSIAPLQPFPAPPAYSPPQHPPFQPAGSLPPAHIPPWQEPPQAVGGGAARTNRNRRGQAVAATSTVLALLVLLVVALVWPRNRPPGAQPPTPTSLPVAIVVSTPTTAPVKPMPPIDLVPFGYEEKAGSDGWKTAAMGLYYINRTGKPVAPETLHVLSAEVETNEGKTYSATILYAGMFSGPSYLDSNESDLQAGAFRQDWSISIPGSEKMGVPPGLPITGMPMGSARSEYGAGFRFAESSHPKDLLLHLDPYGDVRLDLSNAAADLPLPSAQELGARPLSELASALKVDNDRFTFSFEGRCISRIEEMVRNKMVYIPYTVTNKNNLDQVDASVPFNFATYQPGGRVNYEDYGAGASVGPGQTINDLFLIDLLISENDPLPLYLVHYIDPGTVMIYQLNCSEPANK